MALICFLEVVLRYGFGRSFGWYDEFAGYLLVWLTFLGAVLSQQNRQHVGIEDLSRKLDPPYRRSLSLFLHILLVTIHLILLYYGAVLASRFFSESAITLPVPMGVVYLIIPLYGALMLIVLWSQIRRIIIGKPGS
jgi:TRAP-type C4-dicarboxylate transport system permease small subunit